MAYTKIKPIKSSAHLKQALDYITNPLKTDSKIYISSKNCSPENACQEFEAVRTFAMKKGNNYAHHLIQSFSPEDNITPHQAAEIGIELMRRMYPNYQYVIAVHTDRGHIHSHILINSVEFTNYKKLHSNRESLNKVREISDNLCRENGLSVIYPVAKNHRENLKNAIDMAVEKSTSFDEFIHLMQMSGYEVKLGEHIAFKGIDDKRFIRAESIGIAYSEFNLKKRISNDKDIPNRRRMIYDDKPVGMSQRKRLRVIIDKGIDRCTDFNDFLEYMRKENYEIKQGKHIAFRYKQGKKFIRAASIGEYYTEEMLRLRIEDKEQFRLIKKQRENEQVDKVIVSEKHFTNRTIDSKNVDIKIKTLNYLNDNGISSYDELLEKLAIIKEQYDAQTKTIDELNIKISEARKVIRAINDYWKYKPFIQAAREVDVRHRDSFLVKNKREIDKYKQAVEIIEFTKKTYGYLPSKAEICKQLNKLMGYKENVEMCSKNIKQQLRFFENVRNNVDLIGKDEKPKQKMESYLLEVDNVKKHQRMS